MFQNKIRIISDNPFFLFIYPVDVNEIIRYTTKLQNKKKIKNRKKKTKKTNKQTKNNNKN